MLIVFFISGHGFGHASRQVEILNALGARRPDLSLAVRSTVSPDLLRRTVQVPFRLLPGVTDTGIVQASSVAHDDPATVKAAAEFYATYPARVEAEARSLPPETGLIVGDIPALAFSAAAARGLPSIAIGNFTWDWIYETHPGMTAAPHVVPAIREAYRHATLALELPFSGGFEVFRHVEPLPLIARRATQPAARVRARFGIPADRPAALLSFGGYGLPALDLGCVDAAGPWTLVTTDRVSGQTAPHPAVRCIDERDFIDSPIRYEDLVAAVDVVVTKPGYGIIAECISTGTAMLYTSRGQFREYDVLVSALPRYVRSRFIGQPDLFAGRWLEALEALRAQPAPPDTLAPDGAEHAADRIAAMAEAPGA